jgi:hypothetical protein
VLWAAILLRGVRRSGEDDLVKLMVTGSRTWDLVPIISKHLYWFTRGWDEVTLLEGGAVGADSIARGYALSAAWEIHTFLPDYKTHGSGAPHVRNQAMVDQQPDLVLAYIRSMSAGTTSTVIKAHKAGLIVRPFYYEDYV